MATQRRSLVKTILRVLVVLLVAVALAAAGYVGYLSATYYRIDDGIQLGSRVLPLQIKPS